MMRGLTAVPRFHLYGEPHCTVGDYFLHVEHLDKRSRPGGWHIRPHIHTDLSHFFYLSSGGGAMSYDTRTITFSAPCLIVLPAGIVHGFDWNSNTVGLVITVATTRLEELISWDCSLSQLFGMARVISLTAETDHEIGRLTERLLQENLWTALGHRAATDAGLVAIMVMAIRSLSFSDEPTAAKSSPYFSLVTRFRARIEERFRLREPVSAYAAGLGVTIGRLQIACDKITGRSPSDMIDERVMLEAKRALLYTVVSVAEIAYDLGFTDPAYFTRFFTRHDGRSPGAYRRTEGITNRVMTTISQGRRKNVPDGDIKLYQPG